MFRRSSPAPLAPPVWMTWRSWESVALGISGLPREANTYVLWEAFSKEGNIFSIDIFEDRQGRRSSRGRIRFKPPPEKEFWSDGSYPVKLRSGLTCHLQLSIQLNSQDPFVPSPAREGVLYPAEMELNVSKLNIGVCPKENSFCTLRSFEQSDSLKAVLDVKNRSLFIYFKLAIRQTGVKTQGPLGSPSLFRIRVKFFELSKVWKMKNNDTGDPSYVIVLNAPPVIHRQARSPTFGSEITWRSSDTWLRQTSVVHNPLSQGSITTNLRKSGQIIDMGRWNVFKITFSTADVTNLEVIHEIFKDHNIIIKDGSKLTEPTERPQAVWRWIDHTESKHGSMLGNLYDQDFVPLPFPIRYQLEVCLSHRYFSEFAMTKEFLLKLVAVGEAQAQKLLEHVATNRKKYLDPMEIFNLQYCKGVSDAKIKKHCCFMRTARVTPTTIYYNTPTVDTSNRVTRRYIEFADRFLRVRFTDEVTQGRIHSSFNDSNDEIFTRIKRTLTRGITIGDRHYEFLAFGNSQFREHGAYFFAPTPDLTAAHIRAWMGQFNHIRNIAKCAARLGQCFSTTRPVSGCPVEIQMCEDLVRNGYTFSDGVGKISKFLAEMTMNELKIKTLTGKPPSAFQFRLGGCKGLLVVSSVPRPKEIHIRPSQFKFEAEAAGLEIIRWSQYYTATLNRQIILALSVLRISDRVIHKKLNIMLEDLNIAMGNVEPAIRLLHKYVDPNQMTINLARMLSEGFMQTNEPFVISMLQLWKAWHLKNLKEKAHIVIDQGAILFGCMDEIGVLKGQFEKKLSLRNSSYDQKIAALPEIFLQVCRLEKGGKPEVIKGLCILARNPTLHAGDIRVVNAVDKPELRYLYDVVVLPQTGDRDLASMCSGGDLDGDDYMVFWDQDLIPENWFMNPMRYPSNKAPDLEHDVTVDEITSFFVTYMKNDSLPRIAHAHMALADRLEGGVLEEKCRKLARLHSDAVDYIKTGSVANMNRDLEPQFWPHFMEKRHKRPEQIYRSGKILGQIYDAVETKDFAPTLNLPFDNRILECELVPASEKYLQLAADLKVDYDTAMRRIMAQFDIKTEFEVWSTFVMSHNCLCRDFKIHEDIGRVSGTLREGFRQTCYERVGGRTFEEIAPLAVALYRVTHEEITSAIQALENPTHDDYDDAESFVSDGGGKSQLPLISFPWIFHKLLGRIAIGKYRIPIAEEVANGASRRAKTKIYTQEEVKMIIAGLKDLATEINPEDEPLVHKNPAQGCDAVNSHSRIPSFESGVHVEGSQENKAAELTPGIKSHEAGDTDEEGGKGNGDITEITKEKGDVEPNALDDLLRLIDGD
ncbi:hypothetical protein N7520_003688 [Penicillium odoratum]|uniref:uncharacterized protein n=1 Tax=Penicillium odoratum TaxID=1167516 RepID=UPI0025497813|nr:uncharacterized protein N7520_003688 [Penicillium odoratum]KAJ5769129.1 hypothetical protein N7520_003688 [Penicillium odoratum]